MKVHIISIGGRIMHTLALVLKAKGYDVSGSDDEIYNPSKARLQEAGLLPEKEGWDENRISSSIDLVLLGMHARADNPELLKAMELDLKIQSFPEFVAEQIKDSKKIVVAGSHGKTSTVAMIMHVLKYRNIRFDYLVGAELNGFSQMVSLQGNEISIIEGDEYLSSAIDRRPKIFHYNPDVCVITGIAWDHINVFKTEEEYIQLFYDFVETNKGKTQFLWFGEDKILQTIFNQSQNIDNHRYGPLSLNEKGNVIWSNKQYKLRVFGKHNRANMMAALRVCELLGITAEDFFAAISSFKGASRRLELLVERSDFKVYRDFAHAPSKVKATVEAVREKYPDQKICILFELHTYSSLNRNFIPHYAHSLQAADQAAVFFSQKTLEIKKMPDLDEKFLKQAFKKSDLLVFREKNNLLKYIENLPKENCILLIMSSGNFEGLDFYEILVQRTES